MSAIKIKNEKILPIMEVGVVWLGLVSLELCHNLLNHLDNLLPCFGTDLNILAPISLGYPISISNLLVVDLVAHHNHWTGPSSLLDLLNPRLHIINRGLISEIDKHQHLTALPIELISDLHEIHLATEVPEGDMKLWAIFGEEILVVGLYA